MASRTITISAYFLSLGVALATLGVPGSPEALAVLGQQLTVIGVLRALQQVGDLAELILQEQIVVVLPCGCCGACKTWSPTSSDPLTNTTQDGALSLGGVQIIYFLREVRQLHQILQNV